MLEAAILVIFPLCMAMTATSDTFSMTIPNRISIILFLAFLIVAPLAGFGWAAIGWHLLAGLAVLSVCFTLFAVNAMGGGDAKVLAASAVWFGFGGELIAYLGTIGLYGGLLTLIVLVLRAKQGVLLALPIRIPMHFFNEKKGVPYGIAIGLAGLMCYPETDIFRIVLQGFR